MPTLSSGDKALVTGSNGYLAMWIIRGLVREGLLSQSAVRSAAKGKHLQDYFASYSAKFEIAIVPDITQEGAFDEAIKGVHATDDPQELITPALHGTNGVLKSVLKERVLTTHLVHNRTEVKRDLVSIGKGFRVYNENDWNEDSIREVEAKGRDATGMAKYQASKTLAEKAAWRLYNEHKDKLRWDLTVIQPAIHRSLQTTKPVIHDVASPTNLNVSMKYWWDMVVSQEPKTREALSGGGSWVHAHILALEKESAGGERIIVSAGQWVWQEWVDAARSLEPSPLPNHDIAPGFPDVQKVYPNEFDTSKAATILGIKWRSKLETTRDILEDFAMHGW
ncbi:D-lactaldehyde dehydrogenase [Coprinopsis sp. MPI-PUGE-AT-0042]|nr:D-lactaldehyde dehydrogenase [Coprinopsis sp. MPI-PUGE-AT-0042]